MYEISYDGIFCGAIRVDAWNKINFKFEWTLRFLEPLKLKKSSILTGCMYSQNGTSAEVVHPWCRKPIIHVWESGRSIYTA